MIRTRFSPSPTGMVHLGNARAALFSALFATHGKGAFILRIEDTDQSRSEQKFTDVIQDDLHWLGLNWVEGPGIGGPYAPYWQSERHAIYDKYYQKLEEMKQAYPCFCTEKELEINRKLQLSRGRAPRYPGTCRDLSPEEVEQKCQAGKKPTLRFRMPINQAIEFTDLVKGPQRFESDDIGDFIIRRADGTASFLFCNAIDDSLMEISHVIRGEDHLANTPRQLTILQALGMRAPEYGHLSLIMGEDGSKLSKRHGSFSLHDLRQEGLLANAVLNYLARLSHTYEEQNLMTFDELAAKFHLSKTSRAPARFDRNQLLHWQKEAVLSLSASAAWDWLGEEIKQCIPQDKQALFIEVMRQNILFPHEAKKWLMILSPEPLTFSQEQLGILNEAGDSFFIAAQNAVKKHKINLKFVFDDLKTALGVSGKRLFMPIRLALTGEDHGPELVHIASLLGENKMIQRFQEVIEQVQVKC